MSEFIAIGVGLVLGAALAMVVGKQRQRRAIESAQEHARQTLRDAESRSNSRLEEARADAEDLMKQAGSELEERRERLKEAEDRILRKNDELSRKSQSASDVQRNLEAREDETGVIRAGLSETDQQILHRLADISGVSVEQASEELLSRVEQGLRDDAQARLRDSESDIRDRADEISRRLLGDTMQRLSEPVVSSNPGSSVTLTERESRRVASSPELLEQLSDRLDVTLTPNEDGSALRISASDAVRRELARLSLTEVLKTGRSSSNDIDRLVRKQEQRLDKTVREAGVAATRRAGCGRLPDQIINTLGRLQYRYSYGQNQLLHAVETAHLAAMLAHELGADVEIARAGGLLHDLGKAIDREVEGTHAALGGQLALDAGIDPRIAHCISAHHEEVDPETSEALITIVADAVSGARPGARRESLDNYLARLQAIEAVANTFPGVESCYAIQAGRELRVIVNPKEVDDQGAARIALAISERIQESLDYPGQIKVMVIREVTTVQHTS